VGGIADYFKKGEGGCAPGSFTRRDGFALGRSEARPPVIASRAKNGWVDQKRPRRKWGLFGKKKESAARSLRQGLRAPTFILRPLTWYRREKEQDLHQNLAKDYLSYRSCCWGAIPERVSLYTKCSRRPRAETRKRSNSLVTKNPMHTSQNQPQS